MTVALGVHGVGNLRPSRTEDQASAELCTAWANFVSEGLTSPLPEREIPVAYYAHLLDTTEIQGMAEDLAHLDPDTEGAILVWARQHGIDPQQDRQGWATAPVRWMVDTIAARCNLDQDGLRRFVVRFFPELHAYLHNGDTKRSVETVVRKAIEQYRPRVVLAHSLGSVVAYETLWANATDVKLILLVLRGWAGWRAGRSVAAGVVGRGPRAV